MTDSHTRHPHSQIWGDGTKASSDGQFFRASDRAARRGDINLHYGSEPGTKFYSGLSDQYGYYSILPISPTESEAVYVLDGLFDREVLYLTIEPRSCLMALQTCPVRRGLLGAGIRNA